MVELTGLGMWSGSIFDLGCCCIGPPGDHGGGGGGGGGALASVLDPYQMFPSGGPMETPTPGGAERPLGTPEGPVESPGAPFQAAPFQSQK